MALATGTLWEVRATATTGNVNGAGFNPANANFLTDLAATSATGNSPVVSSVSYSFVAGDVGAWVYVKSGTNWTPGFYQIASVGAGAATLSAAIGAAVQLQASTGMYKANTVAGCATTASPTAGTFGVDYSQQDAAVTTATDFTAVGASTTLSSATAAFTVAMVGNLFHQTTAGTGAHGTLNWFEIVSFTNATTVTVDRTPNDGTTSVACTGFIGGAGRLNGLENTFQAAWPASSTVFVKNGTYTISGAISTASTNATGILTTFIRGYNALRGDVPTAAQRPIIACGANAVTWSQFQFFYDVIFTTTAAAGVATSATAYASHFERCKFLNTSSTVARAALTFGASGATITSTEMVSQNGIALSAAVNNCTFVSCYIHDSATGCSGLGVNNTFLFCIISSCRTAGVTCTSTVASLRLLSCTFYGLEVPVGTAVSMSGANSALNVFMNNIYYGWTTGVSVATGIAGSNLSMTDDYFNNTTDATNWQKSPNDLALNPTFSGASQLTGTIATTSGSVLTDSGANFGSVTDNVSFLTVTGGTGTTLGTYLITSHTTTTLTVNNALGTGASADKVYYVTSGTNWGIGTNLQAQATPGPFNVSATTGYLDIGAVQHQSSAGTGGGSFTFVGV